jgi:hypothetical protein
MSGAGGGKPLQRNENYADTGKPKLYPVWLPLKDWRAVYRALSSVDMLPPQEERLRLAIEDSFVDGTDLSILTDAESEEEELWRSQ